MKQRCMPETLVFAQHPESTSAGAERTTKMLQASPSHSKANLDEAVMATNNLNEHSNRMKYSKRMMKLNTAD